MALSYHLNLVTCPSRCVADEDSIIRNIKEAA